MEKLIAWAKEHPTQAAIIGGVGVLVLLWLMGFFSPSTTSTASSGSGGGGSGNASAYYSAEAAQAQAGAAIQAMQIQATNATKQVLAQASTAQAINASNNNAAVTINGQNVGSANTLGADQLQAALANIAALGQENTNNNATWLQGTQNTNLAAELEMAMNTIIPQEIAQNNTWFGYSANSPFGINFGSVGSMPNLNNLMQLGYSPNQANNIGWQAILSHYGQNYGMPSSSGQYGWYP